MNNGRLDFVYIASAALAQARTLVPSWLPGGRLQGHEWVVINPTRGDRKPGSFSVNLTTGRWADFASGDRGGDLVALAAYLRGIRQGEAARELVHELGVNLE